MAYDWRISAWGSDVCSSVLLKDTPAAGLLAAGRERLDLAWLSLPPAEGFAALCALSSEAKQALFAWCIAQNFQAQLAFEDKADPVIEQVGERLGIDFATHWRPAADNRQEKRRVGTEGDR